jgi:SAM-dependent methyltransferase
MKLDLHYVDPRLVELYDLSNPRGADTDFYLQLASELDAHTILDLGCGTGLLTRDVAATNRQVLGVDPAPAMLNVARQHPGADRVQWIEGDSSVIGRPEADLVIMTGNVAQIFLGDDDWLITLKNIHKALRHGGYLAFESRNPQARAWEGWNRKVTYTFSDSPFGPIAEWLEVVEVKHDRVHFQGYNVFQQTGEELVVDSILRFRSLEEIRQSLGEARFTIEQVFGDWSRGPFVSTSRLMIIVARRD